MTTLSQSPGEGRGPSPAPTASPEPRWRIHDGTACPLADPATPVIIRFRNGSISGPWPASRWRWRAWPRGDRSDYDIVQWHPA